VESVAKTGCVSFSQRNEEVEAQEHQSVEANQDATRTREWEAHEHEEAEVNAKAEAREKAELVAIKCRPSEKPVMSSRGATCQTAETAFLECEQREQPKCPSVGELEAQNLAAYRQAHPVSVTTLRVAVVQRPGHTTISPGYTYLRITTNPLSYLTVTFKGGGSTIPQAYDWGELATGTIKFFGWSCAQPNATYHYTVEAVGDTGNPMSVHGSFKGVSRRWCAATKRREQAERNERLRHRHEQERREVEEQNRNTQRFESNCRAIGGTPVTVMTSDGSERVCRSPEGGRLPVPD
jgi:putative hemolysin